MDQKDLRYFEAKCIQEEAPRCQSFCPLHVDARSFCKKMANAQYNEALAILYKTMPIPLITIALCEGLCKKHCLRNELGGSIELPSLERSCLTLATKTPLIRPITAKGKKVALIGTGLSALSAAWELIKKGITPTFFNAPTKEDLPNLLTEKDFLATIASLEEFGCVFLNEDVNLDNIKLTELKNSWDAVLICSANIINCDYKLKDSFTLETEHEGIFAVPFETAKNTIEQIAFGKKLALSVERSFQNVSLSVGREKEDAYSSKLQTDLTGINSLSALIPNTDGYDENTTLLEAGRCMQCDCMQCVRKCAYLKEYKAYPKAYTRQIYNNGAVIMAIRQANTMINSCMLCGLCEEICPEDFSMEKLCLSVREELVENKQMPPTAHEFALNDMFFANEEALIEKSAPTNGTTALSTEKSLTDTKKATPNTQKSLTDTEKTTPSTGKSAYVFFPGCQLTGISPHLVEESYKFLQENFAHSVALYTHCCGAPAHWAGQKELFKNLRETIKEAWNNFGQATFIVTCPTCIKMFQEFLPEIKTLSLWEILLNTDIAHALINKKEYILHDSCSARHNLPLQKDIRKIADKYSLTFHEPELSKSLTQCCGFGGLLDNVNPNLAKKAAKERIDTLQAVKDTTSIVTYCAMCKNMFAKTGVKAVHFLEILFPNATSYHDETMLIGISLRRENRLKLKNRLLKNIWKEDFELATSPLNIVYSESSLADMEKYHILKTDIINVFTDFLKHGKSFVDGKDTDAQTINYRSKNVMFWLTFTEEKTATGSIYTVKELWSHRMEIITPNMEEEK